MNVIKLSSFQTPAMSILFPQFKRVLPGMSHFIVFQCQNEAVRSDSYSDHLRLGSSGFERSSFLRLNLLLSKENIQLIKYFFLLNIALYCYRRISFPFCPSRSLHYYSLLAHVCPTSLVCPEGNGSAYIAHPSPTLWHLAACREHKLWFFSWPCDEWGSHIPDL